MDYDKSFEDLMDFARIPFLRMKQIDDLRGNSLIDDVSKSLWSSCSASLDPGEASSQSVFLSCPYFNGAVTKSRSTKLIVEIN
jgi:hypothetical protein